MSGAYAGAAERRRPRDWHPLAATDPVPGDPDAILAEVDRMKHLAAVLRSEARDLRAIGEGQGLKGRYADALGEGARGLETRLRETAERYERVHGHLTGWAFELESLQADAARVLRRAREERAGEGRPGGDRPGEVRPGGDWPGGDWSGGDWSGGDDELTVRHRASLARVEAQRDERAAHYAARIRDEIDDTIKDSWWERRKNAVDGCKALISLVVDVMSWAATCIAVAAILMTPAGWVAGLAVWLAFGALTGHVLLAVAGTGSWADVALDVFGLLAMGVGTFALRGLRDVRDATRLAAGAAARERATADAARATRPVRDRASAVVNRRGSSRAARARARHERNIARAANLRAGHEAAAEEAAMPTPEASRWEAAAVGGDQETVNLFKDVRRMRTSYPGSTAVSRASEGAERHKAVFQGAWAAASGVDAWDKGAGGSDVFPGKWSYGSYGHFKARYTKEVGSTW
ncbi:MULTISPECIES: hypothetical protein [unclassified Streptomyces]|uniref:hypothetical protein n=1 Tax=unclassified Streptomyces TaxID=2593676 RepID=UPI002E2E5FB5|nr:hypothetical protein [Streptomyces sp. NBC_00223]